MKKIDAHSHIGNFGGWAGVAFTKDSLIEQMREYDIEKTFLTGASFQGNDEVVDAFQSYPEKIVPFVWVNPALDDVEKKLDKYINQERFAGIKMQPLFDSFVADDPVVYPVMDFAREYDVPVFIHCGHPPYSLPWSIGLLAEQYPDVRVTMIHMGHGHGVYIDASIKMAKRYSNLYLEMSGMPMGSKIKEAYETVGSDRIMFGIDSPFHHPTVEIQKVLTCGLDEGAQQDVFYNNAKKLLRL
ncbi:MAG: amidohydrolase family protein [Eubacterium sp.]|nr:amidohydrolase family protein [Eubacterium sp.]MDE6155741.1 amidohydrolase family protein [Eubacterium sp.]